jgi:hypothetical protein
MYQDATGHVGSECIAADDGDQLINVAAQLAHVMWQDRQRAIDEGQAVDMPADRRKSSGQFFAQDFAQSVDGHFGQSLPPGI